MSPGNERGHLGQGGLRDSLAGEAEYTVDRITPSREAPRRALRVVVDGEPATVVMDAQAQRAAAIAESLVNGSDGHRAAYFDGRADGFVEGEAAGFRRGWAACNAEISSLQRTAAAIVHKLANVLPHDELERRRRDEQTAAADRYAAVASPWPDEVSG